MKFRHVPIFAIALLISLLFHGVVWTGTYRLPVHAAAIPTTPPPKRAAPSFTFNLNPSRAGDAIDLPLPPAERAKPVDPSQPEIVTPPPPPKPIELPDPEKYPERMGKADGKGIGTHDAEGIKPVQGRVAENDQPALNKLTPGIMRSPFPQEVPGENGSGGTPGSARAMAQLAPPRLPQAVKPIEHAEQGDFRPGPVSVKIPTHAKGVESDAERINELAKKIGELKPEKKGAEIASVIEPDRMYGPPTQNAKVRERPLAESGIAVIPPPPPTGRPATSPPPAPPAMRTPPPQIVHDITPITPALVPPEAPQQQSRDQAANPGRPGAPGPSNDPGQQADSDSDAFSRIDGVVRQDGKMEVQFGRQVKTVRPKLPISAMIDAALGARSVTLKVSIGRDGNVTAVGVSKSSGSREVDQATLLAMYDWWFEPVKDKQGRFVPDVIFFTLNFR